MSKAISQMVYLQMTVCSLTAGTILFRRYCIILIVFTVAVYRVLLYSLIMRQYFNYLHDIVPKAVKEPIKMDGLSFNYFMVSADILHHEYHNRSPNHIQTLLAIVIIPIVFTCTSLQLRLTMWVGVMSKLNDCGDSTDATHLDIFGRPPYLRRRISMHSVMGYLIMENDWVD